MEQYQASAVNVNPSNTISETPVTKGALVRTSQNVNLCPLMSLETMWMKTNKPCKPDWIHIHKSRTTQLPIRVFHKIAIPSSSSPSSPLRNIFKPLPKNSPRNYYSLLNWVLKVIDSRTIPVLQHFKLWLILPQKPADRIISVFYTERLLDADGHRTTTADLNRESNHLNCIFCRPGFWPGTCGLWQGKLHYGPFSLRCETGIK